jgi:O-glycosyl hydrolase
MDSPHPDPLPWGEGTAIGRALLSGRQSGKSSRSLLSKTAKDSPSPGGEGRGEGERNAKLLFAFVLFIFLFVFTASAATNLTAIDARTVLVRHFDGWGTSLCWWAHVVGGYTNREEYADLAFKQLGLNIVRYNIGGGENPARSNTMELRARVPGFQPEPGKWDWDADTNQRWMLQAAVARGANHVVAFANSPPYWMTHSGSVTGSRNGKEDNLRREFEAPFADYIATVVSNLSVLDQVTFNTVTPMNEPGADWWKLGNRQEGTHMSVAQQQRMINLLRPALDRPGVRATIVASEDNDERSTYEAVSGYNAATLSNVSHIVTHTYNANASARLRELAQRTGKPLWVSEYGDGERSGLLLARRIRNDLVEKRAQAWIYWQFADNAGAWGLVNNRLDGRDTSYRLTRKFHVMAQFSRFIRPGCAIVQANDGDSLAAYDESRQQLIIVCVNDSREARTTTFQLNGVKTAAREVSSYRTSQQEDVAPLPPVAIVDERFTANLPARSVTTFAISGAELEK